DDRLVADGDVLADDRGEAAELGVRAVVADVDDGAVLDVAACAGADEVHVAAPDRPRPQRHDVPEHHIAHHSRHRIHVHPLPERRHHITVRTNVHWRGSREKTATTRSRASSGTSRWRTRRRRGVSPMERRTRWDSARSRRRGRVAGGTSTKTMLVCCSTLATSGSVASALARHAARAWSSARRSTLWSSAWSPAAASRPAWRMPPPVTLRQRRATVTSASLPTSTEPTGAPSPFERHTETLSKCRAISRAGTPSATAALYSRAPSRCMPSPWRSHSARARAREHSERAAAPDVLSRHNRRARAMRGATLE